MVLRCREDRVEWYKQTASLPEHLETVGLDQLEGFFREHRKNFSPATIYQAKARVYLPTAEQLTFVDAGLMPAIQEKLGDDLARLVSRAVGVLEAKLKANTGRKPSGREVFKSVFRLLAAKILQDKKVEHFSRLNPDNVDDIFQKIGRHYSESDPRPPRGSAWAAALQAAAGEVFQFSDLANTTPEALGGVYESSLVPSTLRKELGIHSTPPYLVDYILGKLQPWIAEIPERDRYVFEPACGSAAFLVGAMRLLQALYSEGGGERRHKYLRERICGVELDPFSTEVARLSLTLADIPHSNGWKLDNDDMFASNTLEKHAAKARIVLANPPFESFSAKEKREYRGQGFPCGTTTKAIEMLSRIVPHLQTGAVLGVILPIGALHSKEGSVVRKLLLEQFEILEICVLPDGVFKYSNHETAMLISRRTEAATVRRAAIMYNRVTRANIKHFQRSCRSGISENVSQSSFDVPPTYSLQWRELESIWRYCTNYPRLGSVAKAGEGFSFINRHDLPRKTIDPHAKGGEGYFPAFLGNMAQIPIFGSPKESLCRLEKELIQVRRSGTEVGRNQIVMNHARVGAPWMIRAVLDPVGHAVNNNFLVVRATSDVTLEYLWALLNSPFANAFAHTSRTSRHVLAGTVEKMPVPDASREEIDAVVRAARAYLAIAKSSGEPMASATRERAVKDALLRMDAEVLRLYDLPPRLERQLLDLFSGKQRPGVGCQFHGYFPPGFNAWIPLHQYISDEYRAAASDTTINRCEPAKSPDILAAVEATAELFNEE